MGFNSIDIKTSRTAKRIPTILQAAGFINVESNIKRIPITHLSGKYDGEVKGSCFKELLCQVSKMIKVNPNAFNLKMTPALGRSLESMVREVRDALLVEGDDRTDFVDLVRITAQKPD